MKTIHLKLATFQNHIGHCQLTYFCRNDEGQRLVYCLQQNHGESVRLLRCTQECEPEYECSFSSVKAVFERPKPMPYDSEYALHLKKLCNDWIDNYDSQTK